MILDLARSRARWMVTQCVPGSSVAFYVIMNSRTHKSVVSV